MPHVPLVVSDGVHRDAVRVLVTGFGPFAHYTVNPSWLAVRDLHNILLEPDNLAQPIAVENKQILADSQDAKPIHITALKVPVSYSAVLSTVPKLHARPPVLDHGQDISSLALGPDPPPDGYDLVLHVGVAGAGNLRVEKLAHKYEYNLPDAEGKYAPEVEGQDGTEEKYIKSGDEDAAEVFERARLAIGAKAKASTLRGFGEGYDSFLGDLQTNIDVDGLVQELRNSGIDQVSSSTNAGRYLCDFIYYCSLAEAERTRESNAVKATKVLFVHCPPVNAPLSTEYVTEALKRIVLSVCGQL